MNQRTIETSAPIGALEEKLNALLGNYDRPTDRRTDGQTGALAGADTEPSLGGANFWRKILPPLEDFLPFLPGGGGNQHSRGGKFFVALCYDHYAPSGSK